MLRSVTFAALTIALTSGASAQSLDDVVATVNGTDITLGEALISRMQLPQQYQQLPENVLMEGVIDQLIQQQLLSDSLTTSPKRMELALRNETRSIRAGEAVSAATTDAITDEAIQAAYDAQYADVEGATEWNASHILVETEEEAKALTESLRGGEDFAETAKVKSTGPSGPNGGSLGWFGAGMMVPAFQTTVEGMTVGEVSDPVQTQFGWHVIKLNETRVAEGPSLDDVRPQLESELGRAAIEGRVNELMESATVDRVEGLDPALISRVDLLEN